MVEPLWEGKDPRQLGGTFLVGKKLEGEYNLKREATITLMSSYCKMLTRSMQVVYRRMRTEMKDFIQAEASPTKCVQFLQCWSSPLEFKMSLLQPTLRDCFSSNKNLKSIGFSRNTRIAVEVLEENMEAWDDMQIVLQSHFFLSLSAYKELYKYSLQPQSFPWRLVLMQHDKHKEETLRAFKQVFEIVLHLETSASLGLKRWSDALTHTRWVVWRETGEILKMNEWQDCDMIQQYSHALFDACIHTLMIENSFNDLRDCENRSNKNKVVAEEQLHAVALRSLEKRYGDKPAVGNVVLAPEDFVTQAADSRASVEYATSKEDLIDSSAVGLNADKLVHDRDSWEKTKVHLVTDVQAVLLRALCLLDNDRDKWPLIWMSRLHTERSVVSKGGKCYLIMGKHAYLCNALLLTSLGPGLGFGIKFNNDEVEELVLVDLDWIHHDYDLELQVGDKFSWRITTTSSLSFWKYAAKVSMHLWSHQELNDALEYLKIPFATSGTLLSTYES